MAKGLTALGVETAKPGVYFDDKNGLHLDVGVKRKTWRVKYMQGGKQFRPKIGYFPTVSLAEARAMAREIQEKLEIGAPVVIATEEVQHPRTEKVLTLGDLLDKYETYRKLGGGKRIKSLGEAMRVIRKELDAHLALPAKHFKKTDLRNVRDDIIARGSAVLANRFLAYFGTFMGWAVSEDYVFEVNFAQALKKTPEKKREVTLTEAEIRAVWNATLVMENALGTIKATRSFARFIRFQLCVPSRRGESAALRLENINQQAYWTFGDHKTAEISETDHVLKLPPLAQAQLGLNHKDLGNGSPDQLVFPGHRAGKPLSGWTKMMNELRTMAGIDKHFTIHDLRRTGATMMQDMGIKLEIVDMVLNHAVPGVTGRYAQAKMTAQKAEALRLWNEELQRILDKRPKLTVVSSDVIEQDVA